MTRTRLLALLLCLSISHTAQAAPPSAQPNPKPMMQAQLDVLDRLINVTPDDSPEKPDLLFRRAEMRLEQARQFTAAADAAKRERLETAAIRDYLDITEKFRNYHRLDEVLFYLGYELTQMKHEDMGRNYFKRLIKDFPNSKFIPDVYLSFGEYYFSSGQMDDALKFYEKVLQWPNSRVAGFARYKSAWCHLNLRNFDKAVSIFTELSKTGEPAKLRHEARHDLMRAYAQSSLRPAGAVALAREVAGDEAPGPLLRMLAEAYHAEDRDADCREIAHEVAALDPGGAELCR